MVNLRRNRTNESLMCKLTFTQGQQLYTREMLLSKHASSQKKAYGLTEYNRGMPNENNNFFHYFSPSKIRQKHVYKEKLEC